MRQPNAVKTSTPTPGRSLDTKHTSGLFAPVKIEGKGMYLIDLNENLLFSFPNTKIFRDI